MDKKKPIEVWESPDGTWRYEVMRKYQKPEKELQNPYARWFVRAITPFTPYGELGDMYVSEIKRNMIKVELKGR